ncbi:acetyl-CoA C-acetyltransferase [Duganella sp. 1224]|uniref:acetyl-CoA C-acetyltransferase n=1 Tax=Duganella sp. 1224 TaxID=2587052 RepID=UPI0015CDE2F2|nr:acetyl-CoA C-acetyltransferase [Duganella sp. 1224]NYE60342.1 acetyl-CoA C-acetyltransferase [Duganella sp. 1224]
MSEAYLYEALRTPCGRGTPEGSLHSVKPIALVTGLMRELRERHQLDTALVDDVLLGCATPVGDQGADLARIAALAAGWDWKAAGVQLHRFGGGGLDAINLAAQKVRSGWEDLVVAGGVESMSRVAPGADGGAWSLDPATSLRTGYVPAGVSADLLATLDGYPREQLDGWALRSQQLAAAASCAALVPVRDQNGVLILDHDECLKPATSIAALAGLRPAFDTPESAGFDSVALARHPQLRQIRHLHTSGNTACAADGAALALIGNAAAGARLGIAPRARIVAAAVTGSDPTLMLAGAAAAARKALRHAGLSVHQIDLFEIGETCAAAVLRCVRELEIAADKVNLHGGAIALGDPLGAGGAMLLATLLDALDHRRLRRGLAALCTGAGMGVATIIERV